MTANQELARELAVVVSSVAGVVELYPSEPLPARIARGVIGAAVKAINVVDDARVTVARTPEGATAVTAVIGVGVGHPVPETLRAVGEAVSDYLIARDPLAPTPTITVTVSRIDNSEVEAGA